MERITISLETELAAILDQLAEKNGYASRSEAIRDLIRGWHSQETLRQNESFHFGARFLENASHESNLEWPQTERHSHSFRPVGPIWRPIRFQVIW